MANATAQAPTREDFAAMLEEAFAQGGLQEGSVVKGMVVGIEKDWPSSTSAPRPKAASPCASSPPRAGRPTSR